MKKIITLFTFAAFALSFFYFGPVASAQAAFISTSQTETIPLEDGDHLETTILDAPTISSGVSLLSTTKTITKTRITIGKLRWENNKII